MDTTEQYIKMAIGAFEDIGYIPADELPNLMVISSLWVEGPKIGEFALEITWASKFEHIRGGTTAPNPLGQLYRQDQLQGMVNLGEKPSYKMMLRIGEYQWLHFSPTWEQLWLRFVMHEKYGKRWDGEKWTQS